MRMAIPFSTHSATLSPRRTLCARLSIFRRSAFTATAAANGWTNRQCRNRARRAAVNGWRPRRPGRGSENAAAYRSRSCGSPAFTVRVRMRWCRSRAAAPAASSSRARSSIAFMSATSRRRSTPLLPIRRRASSMSPTTSRRRPAIRSPLRRNSWAWIRRRRRSFDEAAPSMSPMALSFWQECRRVRNDRLKRVLGVALRYPTYREGTARVVRNALSIPR